MHRYNTSAVLHGLMSRDIHSLKWKFENMANTKKPTGDPSCRENLRCAKHIARAILTDRMKGLWVTRVKKKTKVRTITINLGLIRNLSLDLY